MAEGAQCFLINFQCHLKLFVLTFWLFATRWDEIKSNLFFFYSPELITWAWSRTVSCRNGSTFLKVWRRVGVVLRIFSAKQSKPSLKQKVMCKWNCYWRDTSIFPLSLFSFFQSLFIHMFVWNKYQSEWGWRNQLAQLQNICSNSFFQFAAYLS